MKISEIIFKVSLPARTAGGHPPCSRTTESTDGGCDDGTGAEKRTRKTVKFTTEKLALPCADRVQKKGTVSAVAMRFLIPGCEFNLVGRHGVERSHCNVTADAGGVVH